MIREGIAVYIQILLDLLKKDEKNCTDQAMQEE